MIDEIDELILKKELSEPDEFDEGKCRSCRGSGQHNFSQNHPFGSTVATEHLIEDCLFCDGKGKHEN